MKLRWNELHECQQRYTLSSPFGGQEGGHYTWQAKSNYQNVLAGLFLYQPRTYPLSETRNLNHKIREREKASDPEETFARLECY